MRWCLFSCQFIEWQKFFETLWLGFDTFFSKTPWTTWPKLTTSHSWLVWKMSTSHWPLHRSDAISDPLPLSTRPKTPTTPTSPTTTARAQWRCPPLPHSKGMGCLGGVWSPLLPRTRPTGTCHPLDNWTRTGTVSICNCHRHSTVLLWAHN